MSDRVPDPPLTDKGAEQAERVAAHLSGGGHLLEAERGHNGGPFLNELHCSPMIRALETARPIGEAMRLPVRVWVDIHEVGGLFLDTEISSAGSSRPWATTFPAGDCGTITTTPR